MTPISPVIPGSPVPEVVYAKDQPEYIPLPAIRTDDGIVISRWQLTWKERLWVLFFGSIWLRCHTFGSPLQPVMLDTMPPEVGYQDAV